MLTFSKMAVTSFGRKTKSWLDTFYANCYLYTRLTLSSLFIYLLLPQLPIQWMAPEVLHKGLFSPASDVWSFGEQIYQWHFCCVSSGDFQSSTLDLHQYGALDLRQYGALGLRQYGWTIPWQNQKTSSKSARPCLQAIGTVELALWSQLIRASVCSGARKTSFPLIN